MHFVHVVFHIGRIRDQPDLRNALKQLAKSGMRKILLWYVGKENCPLGDTTRVPG
jgi:hypothetical protein